MVVLFAYMIITPRQQNLQSNLTSGGPCTCWVGFLNDTTWLLTMNAVTRSLTLMSSIFISCNRRTYSGTCTRSHTTPTPPSFNTLTTSAIALPLSAAATSALCPLPTVCKNVPDTTTWKLPSKNGSLVGSPVRHVTYSCTPSTLAARSVAANPALLGPLNPITRPEPPSFLRRAAMALSKMPRPQQPRSSAKRTVDHSSTVSTMRWAISEWRGTAE